MNLRDWYANSMEVYEKITEQDHMKETITTVS